MRSAANTAILLAILTLGSKLIGFVREMFMAYYYGTTYVVDAYVVSNSIPNMIFGGVLSAIATSFIPIYSKKKENSGALEADLFTSQTINLLLIVSIISSIIGIIFSDQIVWLFANGFQGETSALASFYVKVSFSYTLFTATAGILESYLKYRNIFLSPAVAGYSVSILSIIFVIISHRTSAYYLVFGMLAGNAIRFFIDLIIAKKSEYKHRWDFTISNTAKEIFSLAFPVFIGSMATQINIFVNRALATRLPEGSASAISYSDLIIGLISGVTAIIISTILYPKMAQAYAKGDKSNFSRIYNSGISLILIIAIPISLGGMLYGEDIVQIIYERGVFDQNATQLTTSAFLYYAAGLVFVSLYGFLIQTFYSMHDTKRPRTYASIGILINIIANLILVNFLAHSGLALGASIAAFINVILLVRGLHKKNYIFFKSDMPRKIVKLLISACISIGISYTAYYSINAYILLPRMVTMLLIIVLAATVYLILLRLFKIEELIYIKDIFKITK